MDLSIIIPVYNAERFLKKCLDSIYDYSVPGVLFEVILVNDGSTDNSLQICREYSLHKNSIRIINKNNEGPGIARKAGLDSARGNHIYFMDSDDYLEADFFRVYRHYAEKDFDIIEFGFHKISGSGERVQTIQLNNVFLSGREKVHDYYLQRKHIIPLWNKIFKKEILSEAIFPKLYGSEDTLLTCQSIIHCDKYFVSDAVLYNYVNNEDSLVHRGSRNKYKDFLTSNELLFEVFQAKAANLLEIPVNRICLYTAMFYFELLADGYEKDAELVNNKFKEYYKIKNKQKYRQTLTKKAHLFTKVFSRSKSLAKLIWIINKRKSK